MTTPSDLRKAEPVSDELLVAAIERAQRHARHGEHGALRRDIAEHLGFIHGSATTRKLRPQIDALIAAGLIEYSKLHGLKRWSLTSAGRKRLAQARRAGEPLELPESPQHRYWRQTRTLAGEHVDELRERLRATLKETRELLDSADGGDSDPWFKLARTLCFRCEAIGSATYCLHEWEEPDDARADIGESAAEDQRKTRRHRGLGSHPSQFGRGQRGGSPHRPAAPASDPRPGRETRAAPPLRSRRVAVM
jgi:hypothetical protein